MRPNFFIRFISKIFMVIFVISYLLAPKTVPQLAFVVSGSKENDSQDEFLIEPGDNTQSEDKHQEHNGILQKMSNPGLNSRFHKPVVLKRRG